MMKYQKNNSTFVPKQKLNIDSNTVKTKNGNVEPSENEKKAILEVEKYNNKIEELNKKLKIKETEINNCHNLIATLEEKIKNLKTAQNKINTSKKNNISELNSLNTKLNNVKKENKELKEKIASQNEQLQFLYILMLIIVII